jgi:hypothetical protein
MNCPCEGCITFVMCKDRVYAKYRQQVTSLSKGCPILDDWIQDDRSTHKRRAINLARTLFGLQSVESVWKTFRGSDEQANTM